MWCAGSAAGAYLRVRTDTRMVRPHTIVVRCGERDWGGNPCSPGASALGAVTCRKMGGCAVENALIILNPWAGRGTTGQHRQAIEATLTQEGIPYELMMTHAHGGAIELAWQGVERGYKQIIAVGGDGTINEVVNGIKGAEASLGKRVQLGIIPLGTGSDFVKALEGIE